MRARGHGGTLGAEQPCASSTWPYVWRDLQEGTASPLSPPAPRSPGGPGTPADPALGASFKVVPVPVLGAGLGTTAGLGLVSSAPTLHTIHKVHRTTLGPTEVFTVARHHSRCGSTVTALAPGLGDKDHKVRSSHRALAMANAGSPCMPG